MEQMTREERARQGDLRAYTVGDWISIFLSMTFGYMIAAVVLMVVWFFVIVVFGGLAAVVGS